jgi:hypothetical protein
VIYNIFNNGHMRWLLDKKSSLFFLTHHCQPFLCGIKGSFELSDLVNISRQFYFFQIFNIIGSSSTNVFSRIQGQPQFVQNLRCASSPQVKTHFCCFLVRSSHYLGSSYTSQPHSLLCTTH